MKRCYIEKRFDGKTYALIDYMNEITRTYAAQNYDLSVRQLYYQLVSRNIVPNTEQSYKRIANILNDARMAGLIDWDAIVDRGRRMIRPANWRNPAHIIEVCSNQMRIDMWENQDTYVEVMVEKQALEGVFLPVCGELDVAFTANKGYSSSSALRDAGLRMKERLRNGKAVRVFYFGDHDPSGIDMTRDVDERLLMFSEAGWYDSEWKEFERSEDYDFEVVRVALNMSQVRAYNPPPNPAKMTDTRAGDYVRKHGQSSWELDALDPATLGNLIRQNVDSVIDHEQWNKDVTRLKEYKAELKSISEKLNSGQ